MRNEKVKRTFYPGDEWLYIKIYAGIKTVDKILTDAVYSIFKNAIKEKIATECFFIRYSDPDFHLRIRFLIKDKENIGKVINLCNDKLKKYCAGNLISRIEIGTYEREIERYGSKYIEISENLFTIDSKYIIELLRYLQQKDENYRWMISLKLINSLFDDIGYDLDKKYAYITKMSESFKMEFGFNMYNSKQLNDIFRARKKQVESSLNMTDQNLVLADVEKIIKRRSKAIKKLLHTGELPENNISSYIHMSMNRLFRSKNRVHELLIYDFLSRYYKSEIAKLKYKK